MVLLEELIPLELLVLSSVPKSSIAWVDVSVWWGERLLYLQSTSLWVWFSASRCCFPLTMFQAGAIYEGSRTNPEKAAQYAPGAVTMLFLFNLGWVVRMNFWWNLITNFTIPRYAATWGTVAFLVPTEIFPSDLRAQGNGFGITGWAIGVGMTTLVNPIMFDVMAVSCFLEFDYWLKILINSQSRTYFLFAGLNLLWIPIVYLCMFCILMTLSSAMT